MKARHAVSRINGLSVWQKIFCTLLAVTLLCLMVPNGLRANATAVYGDKETDTKAEEVNINDFAEPVKTDFEQKDYYGATDFPTLGSSVTFDPKSFNLDETTGYFKVQTAKVTVEQAIYWAVNPSKLNFSFDSIKLNENDEISKEDLVKYFMAIGEAIPYLGQLGADPSPVPFGQLDYYEEEVHGSYTANMESAIVIPDYMIDFAEEVLPGLIKPIIRDSETMVYSVAEILRYGLNSIIPSNTELTFEPRNYPPFPGWPFYNDGSIFMLNLYLGQGNTLMDILKTTNIVAKRVIPINQTEILDPMFKSNSNNLLGSNNADNANVNIQPYFMNWDLDLFGTGYSLPIQSWQEYYGPLIVDIPEELERIIPDFELLNYKPMKLPSLTNVRATANFWDVEGLVPVHLDFGNAYVWEEMRATLRADGWTSTDFISGSTWTKNFWEETPIWYIYSDIMDKFGPWIYGGEKIYNPTKIHTTARNAVFGDEMIYQEYWAEKAGDVRTFPSWENVPFPGPYLVSIDNDNWFGNLDKETTISFSTYAVSPRGHVVHEGHGDHSVTPWERIFDVADVVHKAYVMFYNEWDMPLFSYNDHHYEKAFFEAWPDEGYFYGKGDYAQDVKVQENFIPSYCFDTQIAYAVVYAWDEDPTKPGDHDIYIPLRVNADQFDKDFATLFDFGMCDFVVERLMFADVVTYMPNAGVESFEVTYFEDGQPLFETQTISDPWQLAMLTLPMVTKGTITTGGDRLVTGWNAYMSFNRPFGEVDAFNAFQDSDNYSASDGVHWFQCQIKANMKPGFVFTNWFLDNNPISADTYLGEDPIIVKEPGILLNHWITPGYALIPPAAETADGTAIYGDAEAAAPVTAPVNATPDGNAPVVAGNSNSSSAQTGDSAGFAFAILAMLAIAGAGVLAGRKLYVK